MKKLKHLAFGGLPVTGKGLAALSTLGGLEEFWLNIAGITPDEIQPLSRLTHLRWLYIAMSGAYTKEFRDRANEVPLGDAIARVVAGTPSLRAALVNVLMGDAGAVAISQAGKLQIVDLAFEEVTDARLAALCQLTTLRRLHLKGRGQISDVGLASISGLSRLTDLALPAEQLTDTGLAELAPLADLKMLKLTGGRFNGSGLAALDRLANLLLLNLNSSAFDDIGCRQLPQVFPQLAGLDLTGTRVSDKGLASIARLSRLSGLTLERTKVTDAGMAELKPLENLFMLQIVGTTVTPSGVAPLKAAIPKLNVINDHSPIAIIEMMPQLEDDDEPAGGDK